jgi:hypothetical protein
MTLTSSRTSNLTPPQKMLMFLVRGRNLLIQFVGRTQAESIWKSVKRTPAIGGWKNMPTEVIYKSSADTV